VENRFRLNAQPAEPLNTDHTSAVNRVSHLSMLLKNLHTETMLRNNISSQ